MPFARLENNIVMETLDVRLFPDWVEVPNHDCHGWNYEDGKLVDKRLLNSIPNPIIPQVYRGLNFSLEDIEACENGLKTIEQVKSEMEENNN